MLDKFNSKILALINSIVLYLNIHDILNTPACFTDQNT